MLFFIFFDFVSIKLDTTYDVSLLEQNFLIVYKKCAKRAFNVFRRRV